MVRGGLLIAGALLITTGCGDEIVLIDPPVEFEKDQTKTDGGTDVPSITLGIFSEQFFTPLETGGALLRG